MCVRMAHMYTVKSRDTKTLGDTTDIICTSFVYESSMDLCVGLHQVCVYVCLWTQYHEFKVKM